MRGSEQEVIERRSGQRRLEAQNCIYLKSANIQLVPDPISESEYICCCCLQPETQSGANVTIVSNYMQTLEKQVY